MEFEKLYARLRKAREVKLLKAALDRLAQRSTMDVVMELRAEMAR